MSYQVCPLCKGSGYDPTNTNALSTCPVCKGTRIINELNGLPPTVNISIIEDEEKMSLNEDVKERLVYYNKFYSSHLSSGSVPIEYQNPTIITKGITYVN